MENLDLFLLFSSFRAVSLLHQFFLSKFLKVCTFSLILQFLGSLKGLLTRFSRFCTPQKSGLCAEMFEACVDAQLASLAPWAPRNESLIWGFVFSIVVSDVAEVKYK